jgi:hypothetical protein
MNNSLVQNVPSSLRACLTPGPERRCRRQRRSLTRAAEMTLMALFGGRGKW